jgi:hypothetical protein
MLRRRRPHDALPVVFDFFFEEDECSVKTATPAVTSATTAYLYSGYRFRKIETCSAMTGRSLQLFAKMNVIYPTCFKLAYPNGEARDEVTATKSRGHAIFGVGKSFGVLGFDLELYTRYTYPTRNANADCIVLRKIEKENISGELAGPYDVVVMRSWRTAQVRLLTVRNGQLYARCRNLQRSVDSRHTYY